MTGAVDLFGNPVDEPVTTGPAAPPINDMTLIEKVLQVAENTGYVLVGPSERVYHLVARKTIEAAPPPRGRGRASAPDREVADEGRCARLHPPRVRGAG